MSNILKGLTEGYYSRDEEYQQNAMDTRRRRDLSSERNAGLDEPDEYSSKPAQVRNGIYEYDVPAGQEKIAQDLGLQQHRGHWISRFPIQRANFQFGLPQFHEIPAKGVAEGLNEPPVSYREMINSVQKQYTKWYSELVNHYAQLGNSSDEFKKKIVAAYNAYKNGQSVAHIPIVGPVKEQGVAEGSIEEALQAPPTSTGNELLDEFIGRYVKDGWKYHGTNKRGGHEFRKRRYMPAALYGLKDGGVIESHNNGTRVSRFDSSGKRVAKLADGPLSEQGVAEGSEDPSWKKGWELCDKEPSDDPEFLFRKHGAGLNRRQFIQGFNANAKSRGIKQYGDTGSSVDHGAVRYKEFKREQGVAEGSIGDKIKGAAKSVKRASQGWGAGGESDAVSPKDVVQAFGKMDGQRLANFVASRKDLSKPRNNSARAFADKVIDREMRQRGYGRVAGKDEQGVAEGSGFDKWADDRAASQLHKLKPATAWEVSYDYGPHMTKSVTVNARSEEEARAKVEKAAEKKGLNIMINSVEQGIVEGLSKRDQQDVAAIKAAIARLQAQLKQPNADKADIQQSIAHEKKRLELYGKDLAEDQRLDPSCWKGYKKQGTKMKGDTRVNNCVPVKESAILQGLNQLDEGWKEKLGAAALAGSLALGAGAAHSRVTPDGEGGVTGGLKPTATVTAPSDNKPAAEAPRGFSKEYLQKAADPNRIGRYMISVEKAQELLKSMP